MIIASHAKKELAIQLQVLQSPTTTPSPSVTSNTATSTSVSPASPETLCFPHEYCTKNDFVGTVFTRWSKSVDEHMVIATTIHQTSRPVQCQAFIHDDTVFLTSPVTDRLSNWADGEFQSCVTHLIELAEEKTGCEYLVIALDRRHLDNNTVLRAFMYLGFQMIDPSVYGQEPGFVLVGYELITLSYTSIN
ncbi:hypothetical protein BDA99DRAFT_536914 [Phascolomyces articulosus]|uniref:Ornithine decarboxylase antizyme n=1 Tax=Phascolomyces articulosus TaxID=60185 RepID=A0AAD5K0Y3_9FUNG|nr:hypothetical protein BDA99DRAFT_536914 [Phascolomyces articulosus]